MLKTIVNASAIAMTAMAAQVVSAQQFDITPVPLDDFFNADAWYHDDADDPGVPTNSPDGDGAVWVLDGGTSERIRITTLPENVVPGQLNLTEDGVVSFLLPEMNIGDLDGYYPTGDTIPVPEGNYKYVFFAVMSGSGNWPGNDTQWAPVQDPDTGEVLDQRPELNAFTPVYADGDGPQIPIGIVNDWFWQVPVWVAPESGDPSEVVQQYLSYEGDPNAPIYLIENVGGGNHDYGQYTFVNGADNYFTYYFDGFPGSLEGLTEATLWTEMWGNVKMSISNDGVNFTEAYNSATEDQVYTAPTGNIDGFFPNRELRSFDLAPYLDGGNTSEIYVKFEDAAPTNAEGVENNPWGARVRNMGIFTGPVVESALGARLWPGLVRADGNSPEGGLILIRKQYNLDESRTLTGLKMPSNIPRGNPILTFFAISLGNDGTDTSVDEFMLY